MLLPLSMLLLWVPGVTCCIRALQRGVTHTHTYLHTEREMERERLIDFKESAPDCKGTGKFEICGAGQQAGNSGRFCVLQS